MKVKRKLILGDCLERMKEIPDNSVDAVICDPPYGTTKCKWDSIIDFDLMWEQLKRITKDNGAIVIFGGEPFSSLLRCSNIKNFKYDWIWDKVTARGHLVAKKRPMQQTENISVFQNKTAHTYFPQMVDRPKDKIEIRRTREYGRTDIMGGKKSVLKEKVYDQWYPKNIIKLSNANSSNKSVHPTQKPINLLQYLIKTYTLPGETVLDFTMGSGSTGVACMIERRSFIGIEQDKEYYKIAKSRVKNWKDEDATKTDSKDDFIGKKFTNLFVTAKDEKKKYYYVCECKCGSTCSVYKSHLSSGQTKRCPKCAESFQHSSRKTHGMTNTKVYRSWQGMIQRCKDKNNKDYGGRGIKVCKSWKKFENFYKDVGEPPTKYHTLDRINVNKGYKPGNCKWATPKEQSSNRRNNNLYKYKGEELTLSQWSRKVKISESTLRQRIRLGWKIKKVLTKPVREKTYEN